MSDQLHPLPTSPPARGVSDANEKKMHGSASQSITELSSINVIQPSHQILSPKQNADDNHNHTAVSPTQPLDSTNTTYNTLYNEFEKTLHTEFTHKLRTYMYDELHTDLSERLRTKFTDKPYIEVASNLYSQIYCQLYSEVYTRLSDEVLKKLSKELFMKIFDELVDKLPHDLFMKLINDLHTKLSKELSSYASGQLYNQLFSKLHADIYNQLVNPPANQMTDSADDNHPPCDEDSHHRHHQQQQQQYDQQKQEQPQQPSMAHKDESSTSINTSPQPLSSFTITSLNGQLDIPRLGNMERFDIQSYNVSPFALHIMLLAVLAENPDILLPLESLKECFFDHVHQLNEECFSEDHQPASCNTTVINLVIGVTCTRLNYAIDCLYPPSEEERANPRKRVIPELEEKGCPILQDIIRDSLSVYNPMRVLLSYLRSITTRYNTLSNATSEERDEFIKKDVLRSDGWIRELEHLCSLYGLYLWDSQWITNEEWEELVVHMNIFYTEMFPYVKDDFAVIEEFSRKKLDDKKKADDKQAGGKMFYGNMFDDKKLDDERFDSDRCRVNRYFKSILRCIASCFAFRYRPMKDPSLLNIPYGHRPFLVNFDPIWVKTDVHQQTMQVFPDVLKQCVTEYMKNPSTFHQAPLADSHLEDDYLLTTSDTTADAKGYASAQNYIMSELDDASKILNRWVSEDLQKHKAVKWRPKVVGYGRNDVTPHMTFLIDCIVKHPPTVDPVYNRIKDVFPEKVNLSNIITVGTTPLSGDPGFTYHESLSS